MRVWREAEAAWEAGRWTEAGAAFAAIATKAARVRERRQCREAAERAIDAFRRDDRPAAAAKMARLALDHGAEPVVSRVQLAAVLLDAGHAAAARDLSGEACTLPADPPTHALARDTACGMALAAGDLDAARAHLVALRALGLPGAEIAARFRGGQLARNEGRIGAAEALFEALAVELEPHPGPCGAAWGEVGELRMMRLHAGQEADARGAFAASAAAWTRGGRRAGMMRAEAWGLRVRAAEGEAVHPGPVHTALAYARERGLVGLEADLLVTLGAITGDPAPATEAIARCAEMPLARGRARWEAARLGGSLDADAAITELGPDVPHSALLGVELARRSGDPVALQRAQDRVSAVFADNS